MTNENIVITHNTENENSLKSQMVKYKKKVFNKYKFFLVKNYMCIYLN